MSTCLSPVLANRPACFPPCPNGNAVRGQSDPCRGPRVPTLVFPALSFSCGPGLGGLCGLAVVHPQQTEPRRRHALLGPELPVEIRKIVEPDFETDVGDRRLLV